MLSPFKFRLQCKCKVRLRITFFLLWCQKTNNTPSSGGSPVNMRIVQENANVNPSNQQCKARSNSGYNAKNANYFLSPLDTDSFRLNFLEPFRTVLGCKRTGGFTITIFHPIIASLQMNRQLRERSLRWWHPYAIAIEPTIQVPEDHREW